MRISKAWKICIGVTISLVIIVVVAVVILWFTVLKPKQPKVTTNDVTLTHVNLVLLPPHVDVTLRLSITVENPNRASFAYENTTAYISYRGAPAAQAPLVHDTIPARGDRNITTDLTLNMDSLVSSPDFQRDFDAGCFNFTSSTTLRGKAKVLNLFTKKVTTYGTCQISVYIFSQNATSVCSSKYKY